MTNTQNYWKQPITTKCLELDTLTRIIFFEIMIKARNEDMEFPSQIMHGNKIISYQLKRGQSIFISAEMKQLGIKRTALERSLKILSDKNSAFNLAFNRQPFGFIVSILNYDELTKMTFNPAFNLHSVCIQSAFKQHSNNIQSAFKLHTNNKNVKNVENEKNVKNEKIEEIVFGEKVYVEPPDFEKENTENDLKPKLQILGSNEDKSVEMNKDTKTEEKSIVVENKYEIDENINLDELIPKNIFENFNKQQKKEMKEYLEKTKKTILEIIIDYKKYIDRKEYQLAGIRMISIQGYLEQLKNPVLPKKEKTFSFTLEKKDKDYTRQELFDILDKKIFKIESGDKNLKLKKTNNIYMILKKELTNSYSKIDEFIEFWINKVETSKEVIEENDLANAQFVLDKIQYFSNYRNKIKKNTQQLS